MHLFQRENSNPIVCLFSCADKGWIFFKTKTVQFLTRLPQVNLGQNTNSYICPPRKVVLVFVLENNESRAQSAEH